jgi:hypothetical protein
MSTPDETIVTPEMNAASLAISQATERVRELWGDGWTVAILGDVLYRFVDGGTDCSRVNARMTAIVDDLWDLAGEMRSES